MLVTTGRPLSKPECAGSDRGQWSFEGRDGGNRRLQGSLSPGQPSHSGKPTLLPPLDPRPPDPGTGSCLWSSPQLSGIRFHSKLALDLMLNFRSSPLKPSAFPLWSLAVLLVLEVIDASS